MKPTSIVSLIISVLLIIVGLVTCFIAQNMAQDNGEYLFAEERNDDLIQTVDLTDSEISKIELIVGEAEINIYGRAEKSYIEFVNFRENYYALSATNRVLSFDEIPDVMSMLKFWENGFSFKGMRYILNFNNQPEDDKPKAINIYLEADREIKIFDINADVCTLHIENMTSPTDYNIVTKEAVIDASTLKTTSSFNINAGEDNKPADKVTLNMATAMISNINIQADDLQIDADYFRCNGSGNIICKTGNLDFATIRRVTEMSLNLTSESGQIQVEENMVESPYISASAEDPSKVFKVETKSANIKMAASTNSTETADSETEE